LGVAKSTVRIAEKAKEVAAVVESSGTYETVSSDWVVVVSCRVDLSRNLRFAGGRDPTG
jgi:hypothetical protein